MQEFFNDHSNFIGAKGLVFLGDDILVYKRDNKTNIYPQCIDLPGGGQNGKETPFETFKRELYEEFGLTLKPSYVVEVIKHPSSINPNNYAYFPIAKLPKSMISSIRFGNEGEEYFLIKLKDYITLEKVAWPKLQQLAESYFKSENSKKERGRL